MLPERTSVLIVGAGPTGLAAAISLVHHGYKSSLSTLWKELLRTPELWRFTRPLSRSVSLFQSFIALDSIGCASKLVELGIPCDSYKLWHRTSSESFFTLDLTLLAPHTKYPYILILSQHRTEQILEEHLNSLGVHVHRPFKAVGMKADVDALGSTEVRFESGEVIKAQYVIGADGSKSVIRNLCGITFTDSDGLPVDQSIAQIVLADVTFSRNDPRLPTKDLILTLSDRSFFLLIPLQTQDSEKKKQGDCPHDDAESGSLSSDEMIYRIGFNVPFADGPPPSNPPITYLQDHLNAHAPQFLTSNSNSSPNPIRITQAFYSTRFRTHAAIADKFVHRLHTSTRGDTAGGSGYVFLIGDAAHIHSPAGGQGMNLGVRDAIGLGPALIAHINTKLSESTTSPATASAAEGGVEEESPVVRYGKARRESALRVIRLTKRIMQVMNVLGTTRSLDVQYWILRFLGVVPAVRRMLLWQVSGLADM